MISEILLYSIVFIFIIIILLFAAWNAFVIRWGQSKGEAREYNSKLWHKIGAIVRFIIIIIPFIIALIYFNIKDAISILLLISPFSHVGYNIVINLIRDHKWSYISKSGIDELIKPYYNLIILIECISIIVSLFIIFN